MMKTQKTLLATAMALALGGLSVQAQWTYFDAVDWAQHPDAGSSANLYQTDPFGPLLADTTTGTTSYRYRNTGPGVPAFGTNSYEMSYPEGDVASFMQVTGLVPGEAYQVRLYGVYPQNATNITSGSRRAIEVSYDNANWGLIDNRGTPLNWVDASNGGVGAPLSGPFGDTRAWTWVPGLVTADGSGTVNLYMRLPQFLSDGSNNDRFVLDGFALAVPEPSTFALAGLGAAAMMIFRRRR